ncbi:sodium/proline symporter PutP [Dissulfurirhabdus thermomarina]|uniref:Sodium/proline symporter n=1 Tax=Dissulfurirhabdus thermomarina TaxID=1765737 RepID=A0A6N9TPB4_DISTH|nr:sodium/proline symporter PutP [Dissulfurirhabdus thermomarina]NDY41277.1 sodium/proline symporter PutP [Dissulfurirhabdus thermomarina]NMX23734.1 sodium/proline symporter PutP [Dissulfurirhabdus thermomarina]
MTRDETIWLTFFAYLAAVLAIGLFAMARTRNLEDYLLGGRRLGSLAAALSAGASDMSGWLLLGLPGLAYTAGPRAAWIALGLLAGTWLNWRLVAARLRAFTVAAGALTIPEYLERRFDDGSRLLRVTSALLILFFFLFYTASGLLAGGKLFEAVFHLPARWAVAAGAAAILVYTFLGGFLAVSWTDVFQALLMLLALAVVPAVALARAPAGHLPWPPAPADPARLIEVISLAAWGLGYFGQPHILARFMALESPRGAPRARRIATTWAALCLAGALAAGWAGRIVFPVALADAEQVFIALVGRLLHPLPAGICLAAILAAVMSTADSQLLVAASALTEDFYKALARPGAGARELVWIGRAAVAAVTAAATWIALGPGRSVLDLVAHAWAGFGAAFGPALLGSLFWSRMTRNGALAGIAAGGLTVVVWSRLHGGLFDLYEIVPGFVLSAAAIAAASLLDPGGRARAEARFRKAAP